MELNVWTKTEFLDAAYDVAAQEWTARLRRGDGTVRTVRATHLVLASGGTSAIPNRPALTGLGSFTGTVLHSSEFSGGADYGCGRQALVVGTGTSGHDVAQELHCSGAQVTMMQRSPTCVVSLVPSGIMVYAVYKEGPSPDDIDLVTAAIPFPVLQNAYQWLTRKTCETDRELLDGLASQGFRLDFGPDRTGFHMMFLRRGGGYYINVGCSELIASGDIKLVHAEESETFTPSGLRLKDGVTRDFDLVVLATGYQDQQEGIRQSLGDEIADRVGRVWGFDENYIMRNMWQRTAQQNLWLTGGSLLDCPALLAVPGPAHQGRTGGHRPARDRPIPSTRYDAEGLPAAALPQSGPAPVRSDDGLPRVEPELMTGHEAGHAAKAGTTRSARHRRRSGSADRSAPCPGC